MATLTKQQKRAINSIWVGANMAGRAQAARDELMGRQQFAACAHVVEYWHQRYLRWAEHASAAELSIGIDVLSHR